MKDVSTIQKYLHSFYKAKKLANAFGDKYNFYAYYYVWILLSLNSPFYSKNYKITFIIKYSKYNIICYDTCTYIMS